MSIWDAAVCDWRSSPVQQQLHARHDRQCPTVMLCFNQRFSVSHHQLLNVSLWLKSWFETHCWKKFHKIWFSSTRLCFSTSKRFGLCLSQLLYTKSNWTLQVKKKTLSFPQALELFWWNKQYSWGFPFSLPHTWTIFLLVYKSL